MYRLLLTSCLFLAVCAHASSAAAEEVFVLDDGVVVRGYVVRENAEDIKIRLTGFEGANTITVSSARVVRRFRTVEPRKVEPPTRVGFRPGIDEDELTAHREGRLRRSPDTTSLGETALDAFEVVSEAVPEPEPSPVGEGFFERLHRVVVMSLPKSWPVVILIGFLMLVILALLVAGATRVVGMKAPTVQASSTLGFLLGVFLAADIVLHHELLRADRAVWVLPLQAAVWLGVARAALDVPVARTVPLLAFVLFGFASFVFVTGSVLVTL